MYNLGCMLNETMSGEAMALSVIQKINGNVKFFPRKSRYLISF